MEADRQQQKELERQLTAHLEKTGIVFLELLSHNIWCSNSVMWFCLFLSIMYILVCIISVVV